MASWFIHVHVDEAVQGRSLCTPSFSSKVRNRHHHRSGSKATCLDFLCAVCGVSPTLESKRCETCTLLRVRSVYLGLAKRRQRRKRKKQSKRSPARHWQQRYSRSGSKLATVKSPARGQYPKIRKTSVS